MPKRTIFVFGALALGGCLDIFGGDEPRGDGDDDASRSGATSRPPRGGARNTGGSDGGRGAATTGGVGPSGGATTGGSNTGGATTGGSNTGGSNTGGATTGGSDTGGSALGGGGAGGDPTGGAGMGGTSNGGRGGAGSGGLMAGGRGGFGAFGGSSAGKAGGGGKAGAGGAAGQGGSGGQTCATEQLLTDGNLDALSSAWEQSSYGWTSLVVTGSTAGVATQSGSYLARLGGYDYADDVLTQFVDVPPSATNIVLSFYEQISTTWPEEYYEYDFLIVGVFDLTTEYSIGEFVAYNNDAHAGWVRHDVAVDPSAAGTTVMVAVAALGADPEYVSTLLVDTMSLQARVCR